MNMLKRLGHSTAGIVKKDKPFSSWKESPVCEWEITMEMITIGDLADISKLTESARPLQASYLSKIYLLAKCIKAINGQPVITEEDVEAYNNDHNLSGAQRVDLFGLKVLAIREWTEAVVNRLTFMYDELQDEYLEKHLGDTLPDDLRAATDPLTTAEPPNQDEESLENESGSDDSV